MADAAPATPPSPPESVSLFRTVVQALRGENITIYGTGKQTRAFCYVDDLVPTAAGVFEDVFNVAEHAVALCGNIVTDDVAVLVELHSGNHLSALFAGTDTTQE